MATYKTLTDVILGKGNFKTDNMHYAGDNFDFYKECLTSKPTTYQGSLGEILMRNFNKDKTYDDTFRYDSTDQTRFHPVRVIKENYTDVDLWSDIYTKGNHPISVIPPQPLPPNYIQPVFSDREHTASCDRNQQGNCGITPNLAGTCSLDGGGCGKDGLYPLLDPKFNMREVAKQLILLEDHCFHPEKQCQDCIKKHTLAIEGFLEEAITLDRQGSMQAEIRDTLRQFKQVTKPLLEKIDNKSAQEYDYIKCAQDLRYVRKPICQNYAGFC